MKRKTNSFSNYKYKRRCSIFQEDINKNDELIPDSSSDEDNDNYCFKTENVTTSQSSCTSVPFDGSTSFLKDDTDYKLGVLKGIFKDAYSEKMLLDAVSDTNGLDHAVSVLLESPIKGEKGQGDSDGIKEVASKHTSKFGKTLTEQRDLTNYEEIVPVANSQNSIEDFSSTNSQHSCFDDDSVEQDLVKLIKRFPKLDKEELRDVLKANSYCFEEAIIALEMFSSPVKSKNIKQKSKCGQKKIIDFNEVIDCVVIDDNPEVDNNISAAPSKMSTTFEAIILSDDDGDDNDEDINEGINDVDLDCGLSDGEQDLAMPAADKTSILSLFDSGDPVELSLVKGCSNVKAKKICGLRPFSSWSDMLKKFRNTQGLNEELLWECQTFVKERDKMEYLMNKCESISKDIRNLFEVKSSSPENTFEMEISQSLLVTKEQYITKEPSLVASGFNLKPYQLTGLNWLIAIHKRGLNGILADEMGLGKTIQAVVFLAYLIEQGERGPHLIIVPSSTCDNWKRELERWCPSIKFLHYSGSHVERGILRDEILEQQHDFEVLLTTYTMATSSPADRVFLKKIQSNYAIFDEAHMLKNMRSQRYQQLLRMKPRRMLMLTGTPIQNNLLELMSLLTFVMPNMFAERIEGIKLLFGDNKKQRREETAYQKAKVVQAKRIMEPFVLRRVKKDVLGDSLPRKREYLIECEVPDRQRKVYHDTFTSCCNMMNSGEKQNSSQRLGLVIELRKAANHPLLIRSYYTDDMLSEMARKYCQDPSHRDSEVQFVFEDLQVMSDFEISRLCLNERCLKEFHLPHELIMDSGKFIYLDSILPKMKKEGDRVLLFNQFTMMMDIVEIYLQTRGYKYLRFDGNTSVDERQGLIDRFNNEEDIFIFILSTKAGGLGINLTSANVVILYDSDYNPHNDKQAEDRCHRLGQTREVNVYRLVCKDTIERTILKCANDKIQLHEDVSGNRNSDKEGIQGLLNAVFGCSIRKKDE